jgi:hypothetical protein
MTWILGTEVISEWCQHRDGFVAPIRQGENAEFVEDGRRVGDVGKQPVEVVLVNTLWEEGDNSKELSGVGAKILEHRRGEREFDRGGQARLVLRLQYVRPASLPFFDQAVQCSICFDVRRWPAT